jgi:hypothetical protein
MQRGCTVTGGVVTVQGNGQTPGNSSDNASAKKSNLPSTSRTNSLPDAQGLVSGARATDSARIAKFTNELSRPAVISGKTFFMVYNMELSTRLLVYINILVLSTAN